MTVETIDRVRALAISREALQHAMELAPGIAQVLSDNLLRRLQELACDLRDLERTLAAITEDGRRNRSAVDLRERKASAPGPDLKRRLV